MRAQLPGLRSSPLLLGLALASCVPEFAADNPYDPEAPPSRQAPAHIEGRIVVEAEAALTDVRILAEGTGELGSADATGRFSIELAPGRHVLSIVAPKHETYDLGSVDLAIGERRGLGVVELVALRGRIAGSIALEGETNLTGTMISVSKIDRSALTNAQGAFAIESVPIGEYDLVLLHQGFATASLPSIIVEEGETATVSTSLVQLLADADFAIEGGARYTSARDVSLDLFGFDHPCIQVAEDPDFVVATEWELFAGGAHPYTLTDGDGSKTVYVRFAQSGDDVASYTEAVASQITLDSTAPVVETPSIDDDSGFTHDEAGNITLSLTAFDLISGLQGLRISIDGTLDTEEWTPFTPVRTITVQDPTIDGIKPIILQVRDVAGNETAHITTSVVLDTSSPTLARDAVRINGGATYARSPFVTLTLGSDDAAFVKVGDESGLAGREWQYYPSGGSLSHQLSASDGLKTVFVRFRDDAGNETMEYSAQITLDTTAPSLGTLTLSTGTGITGARAIPFTLDSIDAYASFELVGDLAERGSHAAGSLTTLTLTSGDGPKVVSAVLVDAAGNPSQPFLASITLDTTPPADGTVVVAGGQSVVGSRDVSVSFSDTTADTAAIFEGTTGTTGTCATPECGTVGFLPFSSPVQFTMSAGDGAKTICWRLCDAAGNGSNVGSTTLTLDTTAPALTGTALQIDTGATLTRSPLVTLSFGATDATEVVVGDTSGLAGRTWETFPASGTMTWALSSGDGLKTVFAKFRDGAGNATAEYSATITLDSTAPAAGTVSLASGAAYSSSRTVTLSVTSAESSPSIILSGDLTAPGTYTSATLPSSITLTTGDGLKAVSAVVVDAAGNSSSPATDFITLDMTAPAAGSVTLANGRTIVSSTSLAVAIAATSPDTMQVWQATSGTCTNPSCTALGWVAFNPAPTLTLSSSQGVKTVCWKFCDAAGNGTAVGSGAVTLDTIAPTLSGAALRIDSDATTTRSPLVTLTFGAVGAAEVKVGDSSGLAGRAWQTYPAASSMPYTLPSGDGSKTVYVKFRDDAQNETAEYSATITLDTTAPSAGTVSLASGSAYSSAAAVGITVTSNEPSLSLVLQGDILAAQQHSYASGAWPTSVTLAGANGTKIVTAVLVDAAGNASYPFSDFITLDTAAPAAGTVTLAGGQTTVNEQTIAVTIGNTVADTMQLWEPAGATCDTRACTHAGYVPFATATTFTLSASQGTKTICHRFCDSAGNGSTTGSGQVTLSTYVPRPTPILTSIEPGAIMALSSETSDYTLTISGAGIAFDTSALVGDFTFPCVSSNAASCQADADGGCGPAGTCASTCASSCTVDLSDQIMRNSGTYAVRLATPSPLAEGLGTSEGVLLFQVVAPLPHVLWIDPRGVIQDSTPSGTPIARTLTVGLRGTGLMDNVSYRLGSNYGRILASTDVDYRTREVTIQISTNNLDASDLADQIFSVVNPGPGGGEHALPFGLNPPAVECPLSQTYCTSNLRWTRARLAGGRGLYQGYRLNELELSSHQGWSGGTAAALRRADGTLGARILANGDNGMVPFVPGLLGIPHQDQTAVGNYPKVELQDHIGTSPRITLGTTSMSPMLGRSSGTFQPGYQYHVVGSRPGPVALADVNNDSRLDILVANTWGNDVAILLAGDPTMLSVPIGRDPRSLAVADLNGDGNLDLVVGGGRGRGAPRQRRRDLRELEPDRHGRAGLFDRPRRSRSRRRRGPRRSERGLGDPHPPRPRRRHVP